jgi:hypothetical protein
MKRRNILSSLVAVVALGACGSGESRGSHSEAIQSQWVLAAPEEPVVVSTTPDSVTLRFCAGTADTPGLAVQYTTHQAYVDNGEEFPATSCSALVQQELPAGECIEVTAPVGPPGGDSCALACGGDYMLRAFAVEGDSASEPSPAARLQLAACDDGDGDGDGDGGDGCTFTQGYWKNHPEAWPVKSLTLCGETFSRDELVGFLGTPVQGNGGVALAHQLIAAILNAANDAPEDPAIGEAIDLVCESGGVLEHLPTSKTAPLVEQLDRYNSGKSVAPHCDSDGGNGNGDCDGNGNGDCDGNGHGGGSCDPKGGACGGGKT